MWLPLERRQDVGWARELGLEREGCRHDRRTGFPPWTCQNQPADALRGGVDKKLQAVEGAWARHQQRPRLLAAQRSGGGGWRGILAGADLAEPGL